MTRTHSQPGKKEYREFAWIVGGILAVVFGLLIPWLKGHGLDSRLWLVALGVALVAAGSIYPQCLRPIYRLWMKLGHALGKVNTFLLLHIVFYCIFTPMGFLLRLINWKSAVRKMPEPQAATYRVPSVAQPKERMEDIF